MHSIKLWISRHLANPEITVLGVLILAVTCAIFLFGSMLAPFFASLIIAYLLDGIVLRMQLLNLPRLPCVLLVFTGFLFGIVYLFLVLIPSILGQLQTFFQRDVERIADEASEFLEGINRWQKTQQEKYPSLFVFSGSETPATSESNSSAGEPVEFVSWGETLSTTLVQELQEWGKAAVDAINFNTIRKLVVGVVYLVLVPVLVFFLLIDKRRIIDWCMQFLPRERTLVEQIWHEVSRQISNYIRGKFWEIIIVWATTYLTFNFLGLNHALLISLFVGFSVMIPYVGAAIMYIPIALAAAYQFGWSSDLFWILVAYTIIQLVDGNLLAPVLLSEVTSIHPVALIVAVLICGGAWGFLGVFFAIPLATVVNAMIKAWPKDLETSTFSTPTAVEE